MILPTRRWYAGALALAVVAPVALLWPHAASMFLLADLLWVGLLVGDALRVTAPRWPPVTLTREFPPALSVGRRLPFVYHWQNAMARPASILVRERLPPLLGSEAPRDRLGTIPPHGAWREELPMHPIARGAAAGARIDLRVSGPWGFVWRQGRLDVPWQATVFPNLRNAGLRALPGQIQRRREAGLRAVRRLGEGRVFESLREWVPGDETRIIDWKASAKRGKTMARQYEDERRQHVLILLDAGRMLTAETEGVSRLDAAVDAALHLATSVVEHGDNVGLLVFAGTVERFLAPARGKRALRAVLEALATVEGRLVEPDYPAAFAHVAMHNRKRALTVLFTDVIDRTASGAMLAQVGSLRPRHLPLAVTLRDPALDRLAVSRPADTAAGFERAAAEALLQDRDDALADLRRRGVRVLDAAPDAAARAVVDEYHRLKRRGML